MSITSRVSTRSYVALFAPALLTWACGGEDAKYASLTVAPDVLTLLGPLHGRALEARATTLDGTMEVIDPPTLELADESAIVELVSGRLRALAPGDADVRVKVGGAEATLHVEVLDLPPPFATRVVNIERGAGDGFGRDRLPDVVLGPPKGGGVHQGSTDVVSLGVGGAITLGLDPFLLCDGPGPDLVVFENPFLVAGGDATFAEPAFLTLAPGDDDRATFPCDPSAPPFAGCAGVEPVIAGPGAPDVDPTDPSRSGGDTFDLAALPRLPKELDLIELRDAATGTVTGTNSGFDLDAVALVHVAPNDADHLAFADDASAKVAAGRVVFAPRVDLVRKDGSRVRGVAVELAAQPAAHVAFDGAFLKPMVAGPVTLTARLGSWTAQLSLEVTAP